MIKITTLFKKNPDNLALVTREVDPQNEWVFTDEGVTATRKFDGTACAIINGQLYKRYDVKKGRSIPEGAIECQPPDEITGHHPHWLKCDRYKSEDRYFFEGWANTGVVPDGTYELIGEKVQGNPEKIKGHQLVRHGAEDLFMALRVKKPDGSLLYDFDMFKKVLETEDIEGIVFHHPDGRMCKIRKSDFGIKR